MARSISTPISARRVSWLRRALFQVHLWTGLAVGLYAVAISVSGSILVYAPVFEEWAHRDFRLVAAPEIEPQQAVTPSQALDAVRRAPPGRTLLNLEVGTMPRQAHVVGLLDRSVYRDVFVHPITAVVSPPVDGRGA